MIYRLTIELELQPDPANPNLPTVTDARILHIQTTDHHHPSLQELAILMGLPHIKASLPTSGATPPQDAQGTI